MNTTNNDHQGKTHSTKSGIVVFRKSNSQSDSITDYCLEAISDEAIPIVGTDSSALKGHSIAQLLPLLPPDLHELISQLIFADGKGETEFFHASASRWYTVGVTFLAEHMYLTFNDITHFKTNTFLETFFDYNLEMFSIFDKDGQCMRINNEWKNVLGYTFEELQQHSYTELIHPDDINYTMSVVSTFSNNQKIFDFTNRLRAKDGSYKYIEWRSCFVNGFLYSSSRDITNYKLHEDEIENQEKLTQILENLEGVFFLLNADMSNLLYITPGYTEIFGEGNFDFNNYVTFIQKIIHRDDLKRYTENLSNYLTTGVFKHEYRIWKSRRECIWVYASVFKIFNKQGEVIRHAGFVQDITARKKAELAEKEAAKRIDAIITTIPDVLITYNSKGEYLDLIASHPESRIFNNMEATGKHISDFFPPDITERFMNCIQSCLEQKTMQTIVFEFEENGVKRHFENRFSPIDNERVLSVVRDISHLVLTEQKLRLQLELQQSLITISTRFIRATAGEFGAAITKSIAELGTRLVADRFYIFSYDDTSHSISNTYEWVADGVERLYNLRQQISVLPFINWIDFHKKGNIIIIDVAGDDKPNDPLKQLINLQGVKRMVAVPLINNDTYIGFIGIDYCSENPQQGESDFQLLKIFAQHIISKKENIKNQLILERALLDAKESDRVKSTFLATLSHELRTPLNHIIGFSQLLQDKIVDSELKDYLSEIYSSGNQLKSMIEDMFTLAFSAETELPVRKSIVNGIEFYTSSKSTLKEFLTFFGKENNIRLEYDIPAEVFSDEFYVDKQKILQILTKLFHNAVKFTETGTIRFSMHRTDSRLNFSVCDTGIGIAPDFRQRIFDAFRQVDEGYSRNFDGLGIGLSIAQKTADSIGATLTVESTVGEGSCFTLSVPVETSD